MTELPKALRIAPFLFYGLAAIYGLYLLGSNWSLMSDAGDAWSGGADAGAVMKLVLESRIFLDAIVQAAYLAANGAIVHVLIAIFDKMKGQPA